MKPRLMVVSTGLGVGGAERALERLLPALARLGFECAVVSLREPQPVGERLRAAGIKVFELGMAPSRPSLRGLWRLWRVARAFRPDVLQGWMYHGDVAAHLARLACPRARVVLGIHQTLARLELESRATRAVIRADAFLSRWAARVVYVARAAVAQHEAAGFAPRASVLPNAIDTASFHPDAAARLRARSWLGVDEGDFLFGMVARLHPAKNHAGFLRAAARLARARPNARFVLMGSGVEACSPELAPWVADEVLEARLYLLGPREDVAALLPALDAHVLCSIQEALPNVVAEAMSAGLPGVVSDVGDVAWMVGDSAQVVPPGDDAALEAAMCALLDASPAEREAMAQAARTRAVELFSAAQVAGQYAALYRSLLAGR